MYIKSNTPTQKVIQHLSLNVYCLLHECKQITKLTFTHFLPFDELTFVQVSIPLDHVFD